jgi:hypothetical protein
LKDLKVEGKETAGEKEAPILAKKIDASVEEIDKAVEKLIKE